MSFNADKLEEYFDRLWPICRSLTGQGVRDTLEILSEEVSLSVEEIASGYQAASWTVPPEWNIRDAYIAFSDGRKLISFQENNLHVVGYSQPVSLVMKGEELLKKVHVHPELSEAIPYLTSYYKKDWGFCLNWEQKAEIERHLNDEFIVRIDSDLNPKGRLNYGEAYLVGESSQEIVFSTLICHPSMANNELSGPLMCMYLYNKLKSLKTRKYSYRFLFLPETIGSILYLDTKGERLKENCVAGFMVTCVGKNSGRFYFKRPRREGTCLEGATLKLLKERGLDYRVADFNPSWGCDDRQYCSPYYNLPFGTLSTTMQGEADGYGSSKEEDFLYYHTSLDDKSQMDFDHMVEVGEIYLEICQRLELRQLFSRTDGKCEPFLSNTGLYPTMAGLSHPEERMAMMWLLNYSDGGYSLDWISYKSGYSVELLQTLVEKLLNSGLIQRVQG